MMQQRLIFAIRPPLHQYKGSHPRESMCKMLTFPELMMQDFIVMLVISQQDSASVCFSLNIWDNYIIGLEDVPPSST
jgi:hypothetical protein